MTTPAPTLRDRTARHARRRRRERIGRFLRFGLAFGATIGIGVGVTTAAWEDSVTVTTAYTAAGFQMQYSYDHKLWCDFPADGTETFGTDGATTGDDKCSTQQGNMYEWVDPASKPVTHQYFFTNAFTADDGSRSTTEVTIEPVLTGMFQQPGVVTIRLGRNTGDDAKLETWNGGPVTVTINKDVPEAKVMMTFTPSELTQSEQMQAGSFELKVTGRIGSAQGTP